MNSEKIAKYLRIGCGIESRRKMTIPAMQKETIINMINGPEELINVITPRLKHPVPCMARERMGILTKKYEGSSPTH